MWICKAPLYSLVYTYLLNPICTPAQNFCITRLLFSAKNMVETTIWLELWDIHYVKLIYHAMILFLDVRTKPMKPWVLFLQVSFH